MRAWQTTSALQRWLRHYLGSVCLTLCLTVLTPSLGAQPMGSADVPANYADTLLQSERFRRLAAELRCLVCQNQTLADSHADLATDLRNAVLEQMAQGRNDQQIKDYLVARYGEFVLYKPTFSPRNLVLWIGPAALLIFGLTLVFRSARRSRSVLGPTPVEGAQLAEIEQILRVDRAPDSVTSRPHPPE